MIDQQTPLLTSKDVCEWLNISGATLSRMVADGDIVAHRIRGEFRFDQNDVKAYLASTRTDQRNNKQS